MTKNKKIRIFLIIILTFSLMQFMMPNITSGQDLEAEAEQIISQGITLYVGSPVSYVRSAKTMIDETNEEVFPIIRNERTLVPVRFVCESMGGKVDWDGNTYTVTITLDGKTIKLSIGSPQMYVNNQEQTLDVVPVIMNERTMVPLRALSEAIDKEVFYDRDLIIISDKENILDPVSQKDLIDELISRVNVLPTVDNADRLKELLAKAQGNSNIYYMKGIATDTQSAAMNEKAPATPSADYSTTNVQVQGVDESDIIKNDGEFIYQVNNREVFVIKASPAEEMKLMNTLSFEDKNFMPQELYLDDKNLVVIGSTYKQSTYQNTAPSDSINEKMMIMPPYYMNDNYVKAIVYNKTSLNKLREIEVEGNYVSSRKIGSSLYLVSNQNIMYYIQNVPVPAYRDSNVSSDYINVAYDKMYYFPCSIRPNYMNVAGVNLADNSSVNVSSYLGASENMYASLENLYVAATDYNYEINIPRIMTDTVSTTTATSLIAPQYNQVSTLIYKFALGSGNVKYMGKGEVPGTIDNQFSMDENNGYFRITTTAGEMWRTDQYTSKNNLYVLDKELNTIGILEGLAPGERIYSTRFIGDRAYVVTFKNTDPLFVIDLKEPTSPKILGTLKIPGYSEYLHPYDETHIIGFGKEAIPSKDTSFAWYQGMKIAMFDVSDVNNPIEMFKEDIGDRGTDSELLHNHKALLFSKEKNLLAFPVTVMEIKDGQIMNADGYANYGTFTFQGAYVYNVDLENGFKLKGKVTHLTDADYQKAGDYWYDSSKNIERIVYIGDVLYTLSKGFIKANDIDNLTQINSLKLPVVEQIPVPILY